MRIKDSDLGPTFESLGLVGLKLGEWVAIQESEADFLILECPFWSKTLLYRPQDGKCITRIFSQVLLKLHELNADYILIS